MCSLQVCLVIVYICSKSHDICTFNTWCEKINRITIVSRETLLAFSLALILNITKCEKLNV